MKLTYKHFKIMLSAILIISSSVNIYLCVRNLSIMKNLLLTWIIVFVMAILFLIFFTREKKPKKGREDDAIK